MMRPIGSRHDGEVRPGPLVGLVTCRGNRVAIVPKNVILESFLEFVCPDCLKTYHLRAVEEVAPRAAAIA